MLGLLRPGILDGLTIVVAGGAPRAHPLARRCAELGASVESLTVDPFGDEPDVPGTPDVLVWDATSVFGDSIDGVRASLDGAWLAIRATMGTGKIVLLAPPDGSAHAQAARAGLENLARTTSIEWAQYGIRTVTIAPAATTRDDELTALVAYLLSPAGDYFSGTRLELS